MLRAEGRGERRLGKRAERRATQRVDRTPERLQEVPVNTKSAFEARFLGKQLASKIDIS